MSDIADQRAAVVAEAQSWLRTPYHHAAMCKGAGWIVRCCRRRFTGRRG